MKNDTIVDPEIISVEEYKTNYPADTYDDSKITQAITMSYEIINYKYCANAIGHRWDLEEDKGGFTDIQKHHIKKAFFIQSRYLLQTGLMAQKGTIQRSNGSQNVSVSIPQRDTVYETVIYCLEQAGITTMFSGSSVGGFYGPFSGCKIPNFNKFVTWDKGNEAYVKTMYTPTEKAEEKKNRLIIYNEDAMVEWITVGTLAQKILPTFIKDKYLKVVENHGNLVLKWAEGTGGFDPDLYYTRDEVNTLIEPYQKKQDDNLETTSKTIVGAINEINGKHLYQHRITIIAWRTPNNFARIYTTIYNTISTVISYSDIDKSTKYLVNGFIYDQESENVLTNGGLIADATFLTNNILVSGMKFNNEQYIFEYELITFLDEVKQIF